MSLPVSAFHTREKKGRRKGVRNLFFQGWINATGPVVIQVPSGRNAGCVRARAGKGAAVIVEAGPSVGQFLDASRGRRPGCRAFSKAMVALGQMGCKQQEFESHSTR